MALPLAAGDWSVTLAPEDGAGITAMRAGGRDILVPAPAGAALGGPFGAFWMIPWANRLDAGRLGPYRLPVSAAPSPGLDGGEEAFLGLDTHFAGWDGAARIAWPGLTLHMRATGALATNLQVYAPRARTVLCVEPSSHLPDVANRPDMAALGPMRLLPPGESLTGRITLTAESSHQP